MRRQILSLVVRSSLVVLGGCNAIVGTQDIHYVTENSSTPPGETTNPPAGTGDEGDGGPSVVATPDANASPDASSGDDGGIDEGSDASASVGGDL